MLKWYLVILFFCHTLSAIPAKVSLISGETYEGEMSGYTLSFKDIFRKDKIRIRIKEIYRLDLLYENISSHIVWNSRKEQEMQQYILAITTWKGQRYWARLRYSFELVSDNKKYKIIFPNKRYIDKETEEYTSNLYASSVVFTSDQEKSAKEDFFPSLEGNLDSRLEGKFTDVYAIHYELGTLFKGSIYKNRYSFKNIFPGSYDIIFVGKEGIAFSLTKTARKKILDQDTSYVEENLYGWIQGFSNFSVQFDIMFYTGYFSDTRVIVWERKKNVQKIVLWVVQYNISQKKWKVANKAILFQQQPDALLPQLLIDQNLGNITVGYQKTTYDYFIYGN